jgi:sulfite reductase (NADPH) flavoprotein alpha-component
MYDKNNPFYATIKERYSLCSSGSLKNTQHIVLDLKNSGLKYNVGDSIAVFPVNDPDLVARTLKAMQATGQEFVTDKAGESIHLETFLTQKANLTDISRKLLGEVAKKRPHPKLEELEQDKELLKAYLNSHEIWDLLEAYPEAHFTPDELCSLMMPLLPRFYSIASSMNSVGDEVHLTVALLKYYASGHLRLGVCTHYLCNLVPIGQPVVPVYIHPNTVGFTIPEDPEKSIIMIGPGTGIAPFRAFMQERMHGKGNGKNWLFFGEWNREHDYFYQDYWHDLEQKGFLRVDLAFSRDQDYKIYVQHRMKEHGKELYQWIKEGAVVYVCGDAHRMAKDVDATLHHIVQEYSGMSEADTKAYFKEMKAQKRYLRDVY